MQNTNPARSQKRMSVEDWVANVATPGVRTCLKENGMYCDETTGSCIAPDECIYRLPDSRCKIHGERVKGDTFRLIRRQKVALSGPSVEDCIRGGQQFYHGGICLAVQACIFQTEVRFTVKANDPLITPGKYYAKCKRHYTPGKCVNGKRLMCEKGACLLTDAAECRYQLSEPPMLLQGAGGKKFYRCTCVHDITC